MGKKSNKYMLLFSLIIVGYSTFNLYTLISRSYVVSTIDLYKIDTFHLLGRAVIGSDAGRPHDELIKFQSTNRFTFLIPSDYYKAVTNKTQLWDTLQYHDLKFTIFSNKKTLERYKKDTSSFSMDALQIKIGGKEYVDLDLLNQLNKQRLLKNILVPGVLGLLILFLIFKIENGFRLDKKKLVKYIIGVCIYIVLVMLMIDHL